MQEFDREFASPNNPKTTYLQEDFLLCEDHFGKVVVHGHMLSVGLGVLAN
jgi:hypothetical protein